MSIRWRARRLAGKAADAAARLQVAFDEAVELSNAGRLIKAVGDRPPGLDSVRASCCGSSSASIGVSRRGSAARRSVSCSGCPAAKRHRPPGRHADRACSGLFDADLVRARGAADLRLARPSSCAVSRIRGRGENRCAEHCSRWPAPPGRSVVDALPNLFTLLLIVVVTRFLARLATLAFVAVEDGRLTLPWVHPDTAPPTRRIVVALLWLFALIVSYPYLPGSQSEVFKGVSVFVGLIVSLGSTGVMNQLMSGLMVTYSRALRCGDFVRVATSKAPSTTIGSLSTKIRTPRNEEVTIPNAVVVSHATTNYSRNMAEGVYASTSVTIGYDTPWRQVQALLLLAAARHRRRAGRAQARRAADGAAGFLRGVHAVRRAGTAAPPVLRSSTRSTPTSRTRSTSTACRSCRRGTINDPRGAQDRAAAAGGIPRRPRPAAELPFGSGRRAIAGGGRDRTQPWRPVSGTAAPRCRSRRGFSSASAPASCVGLFVGEHAAALKWAADGFVKLLQMTVLPYVTLSIVGSLGTLQMSEARALAWRAGAVLVGRLAARAAVRAADPAHLPARRERRLLQHDAGRAAGRRSISSTSTSRPTRSTRSPTTSCRRWCSSR